MRDVGTASIEWLHQRMCPVDCSTDGVISVQTATVKTQGLAPPDDISFRPLLLHGLSIKTTSKARTLINPYPVFLRGQEFLSPKYILTVISLFTVCSVCMMRLWIHITTCLCKYWTSVVVSFFRLALTQVKQHRWGKAKRGSLSFAVWNKKRMWVNKNKTRMYL